MKLVVGSIYLGVPEAATQEVVVFEGDARQAQYSLSEIARADLGAVQPYLLRIDEVVVGFTEVTDLEFLRYLPNVREVSVMTNAVRNIEGLRYLDRLISLSIERPRAHMGILGELQTLEQLYLDAWRSGADSIFSLRHLVKVGIQRFDCLDLQGMADWSDLQELWLNRAKVETLLGIPPSLKSLRLTDARKLCSLAALEACLHLEELELDGCRCISALDGLEACLQLRLLTIGRSGPFETLQPLRKLKNLKYLFLADGTKVNSTGIDVLYGLPRLETLVISKRSGLDVDRLHVVTPNCNVILAS
jgi:hypothetical protein